MKNIIVLGATGSIGIQTLDIIEKESEMYSLKAFSFGRNVSKAIEIINKFKPLMVCTPFEESYQQIKDIDGIIVTKSLVEIVSLNVENPYIVNAIVGVDGLVPTITAIKQNKILLLANKESLVMAGELINTLIKKHKSIIIPIDSEHSALYQLLKEDYHEKVTKLYITASGGALRDYPLDKLAEVTKEDALKHPNWNMGAKITIDSATMMNKVFELIEAHYLFNYPIEKIKAVMDRTSTIHAMVELESGKLAYHVADNDMHLPIKYALEYPDSNDFNQTKVLSTYNNIVDEYNIKELDIKRYRVLELAEYVIKNKKFSGVVLTTINDLFVEKFLNDRCGYKDIENNIFNYIKTYENKFSKLDLTLENIIKVKEIIIKEVNEQW